MSATDHVQRMRNSLAADAGRHETALLPDPDPEPLWCPLISADDHVLESSDLFAERVPSRLRDRVPRLVYDGELPWWQIEDDRYPVISGEGAVGRPTEDWTVRPAAFDEFRPGVIDPTSRLADMDQSGIWASVCFPSSTWGFSGRILSRLKDVAAAQAAVRAYNDWMIDEWCSAAPDRYIPVQMVYLADPSEAAAEVKRNAARGFRAVSFSEDPSAVGFPSLYSGLWDPLFEACVETETVICLHVGSSGRLPNTAEGSPPDAIFALLPVNAMCAVVDWIFARVPQRFPGLRIVMSESGVSWVPAVVERLRRAHRIVDAPTSSWTRDDPDPVELLHRNFWFTSIEDPAAFRLLDVIGADRIMAESDYPHIDSSWPNTQAMLRTMLAGLPDDQIKAICYQNAAAVFDHQEAPADWVAAAAVNGFTAT